jgi:hypothetical protein
MRLREAVEQRPVPSTGDDKLKSRLLLEGLRPSVKEFPD